jgi:SAM-dependent methyltransferase
MGLGLTFLRELIDLKTTGALERAARVVEIGAQQLADSLLDAPELPELYRLFGRQPEALGSPVGPENFAARAPSSRLLWTSLGLEYAAIDLAGDAIPLDLNRDPVPESMVGQFDLIINAGTTEHVANQDNAFRVIHDLCRPRGLMIHEVPSQGMMTHGLISYPPKFFWRLSRENSYEVVRLRICADGEQDVPADVMETNATFGSGYLIPEEHRKLQVFTIRAALRKLDGLNYASPRDYEKSKVAERWSAVSRGIRWLSGTTLGRAVK